VSVLIFLCVSNEHWLFGEEDMRNGLRSVGITQIFISQRRVQYLYESRFVWTLNCTQIGYCFPIKNYF